LAVVFVAGVENKSLLVRLRASSGFALTLKGIAQVIERNGIIRPWPAGPPCSDGCRTEKLFLRPVKQAQSVLHQAWAIIGLTG